MSKTYYSPDDLPRFPEMQEGAPDLWRRFNDWYGAVFEEGALSAREKALMALAVSHALQCPYCIDAWTEGSLGHGATLEQMTEAAHVAAALRGGAALVHGVQMRHVHDRLTM